MEHERKTRTAESNYRADPHPKKVIPYKEYAVHKKAERRVLTTSKPPLGEEENWDEEPPLPPHETPPGAKSMAPSQEDEWKFMVNQDPRSGSVTGDSGHGTMAATGEDEPIDSTEELVGAVGGVDESVAAEHLSDVKWRDGDPLFMFDDENVTKPQTQAAASTPVQTWEEDKAAYSRESPLGKKPCFQESIMERLLKTASPTCLEPDYSNAQLVRYTQLSLVNVISWIKYEAQNVGAKLKARAPVHQGSQTSLIHHSHDSVVLLMEARSEMVAIASHMQFPSWGSSYS